MLRFNLARKAGRVRLFEVGRVFMRDLDDPFRVVDREIAALKATGAIAIDRLEAISPSSATTPSTLGKAARRFGVNQAATRRAAVDAQLPTTSTPM